MTHAPRQEPPSDRRIFAEKVRQLYDQSTVGLAATVVNAGLVALVLRNVVAPVRIWTWLTILVLLALVRSAGAARFRRATVEDDNYRPWIVQFVAGIFCSGLVWGSAGIFLLPAESVGHQAFLAFVLGGMVAGAGAAFSSLRRAFIAFAVPALFPIIVRFFSFGDEVHLAMAAMVLLFFVLMLFSSDKINRELTRSLLFRFENSDLIARLSDEKERVERLNKDLKDQIAERLRAEAALEEHRKDLERLVEERTEELSATNERLRAEIGERKKAEAAHKKSEEYFRTLIENNQDIITVLSTDGTIRFQSPSVKEILGYDPEAQVGKNVLTFIHPDDTKTAAAAMALGARKPGMQEPLEIRFRHRDETWRLLEIVGTSVSHDGEMIFVMNSRDITERREMEAALTHTRNLESLGVLAGGIAHDFNNILTAVFGNIELARMHVGRNHKAWELLGTAGRASERAQHLTRQLLTFAKGGEPVRRTASIENIIRESANLVLSGSPVRFFLEAPSDLRAVDVDEGQMEQVFHNLLINAKDAMPGGGGLSVICENIDEKGNGDDSTRPAVRITITDNGAGIAREDLPRIFDPYFSTKQRDSRRGTGLGLATCHSIIRRHGGRIWAESTPGEGTSFFIVLPASDGSARTDRTADSVGQSVTAGHRGRILVMEDDDSVIDVTAEMLDALGYTADFARNGAETVSLFSDGRNDGRPYDAVILDLTIRGGAGAPATLKRLRDIDSAVRAIVTSGYADDPVLADPRGHGFSGALVKPFSVESLSDVLSEVLAPSGRNTADPRHGHTA